MLIRPYEDADEPAVIALWGEDQSGTAPHNDPATVIRNKLLVERDLFLVAVIGGIVAGRRGVLIGVALGGGVGTLYEGAKRR